MHGFIMTQLTQTLLLEACTNLLEDPKMAKVVSAKKRVVNHRKELRDIFRYCKEAPIAIAF